MHLQERIFAYFELEITQWNVFFLYIFIYNIILYLNQDLKTKTTQKKRVEGQPAGFDCGATFNTKKCIALLKVQIL